MTIKDAMTRLVEGRDLERDEMKAVMYAIMGGDATPAQIGGVLVALRMKGETVEEIAAAAEVLRELALNVPVASPYLDNLVDTCGTGGDSSQLFNVSTAAALVAAAAGARVAKHGNRSVSSSSGSADVLEAAGVALDLSPESVAQCVHEVGVGFMYAPAHHGAMRHAVGPRREMGVRTLFNLLGPLTNPAGARNQIMGVFNGHLVEPMAKVLYKLGSRHVMVVHSGDGLDEISINAPTRVAELRDGDILSYSIVPDDLGLERASLDQVRVAGAAESYAIIMDVLGGKPGPARDTVVLNAAAALYVAGTAQNLAGGVARAQTVLDNGAASDLLRRLSELTQRLAG
jgi:anthranilate phosphoribosyltransferase